MAFKLAFEPDLSRKLTGAGPVLHPSNDFLLVVSQEVLRGGGGGGGGGAAETLCFPSVAALSSWLVRFPPAMVLVLELPSQGGCLKVVADKESESPGCNVQYM